MRLKEMNLDSTSVRRHDSVASNDLENEGESSYSNHRNSNIRTSADYGQNSAVRALRLRSIGCQ